MRQKAATIRITEMKEGSTVSQSRLVPSNSAEMLPRMPSIRSNLTYKGHTTNMSCLDTLSRNQCLAG
jgi:hypothetical protein